MPLVRITPACLCRIAWIAVFAWAATIYWFSSQSGDELERMNFLELWDKAAHFSIFAVGAVPMVLALRWSFRWPPRMVLVVSIVALSLYGAADEIHQVCTPGRSGADLSDWIADALGSAAGTFATLRLHARTQRPNRPAPARD
jgi:VanZ family protein